jgi:hypothetical protein
MKAMPKEFVEVKTPSVRGEYRHLIKLKAMKLIDKSQRGIEIYEFQPLGKLSVEGLNDFVGDIHKIAKQNRYARARNPDELKAGTYLLGKHQNNLRLCVYPVA